MNELLTGVLIGVLLWPSGVGAYFTLKYLNEKGLLTRRKKK